MKKIPSEGFPLGWFSLRKTENGFSERKKSQGIRGPAKEVLTHFIVHSYVRSDKTGDVRLAKTLDPGKDSGFFGRASDEW